MTCGIDGFAFAAESLIGRFVGAADRKQFINAVKYSFYWGIGLGIFIMFVFAVIPEQILSLFTNNQQIISLAMVFMIWTIIAPVVNGFCYVWDGIFIGATASGAMRNSSLICTLLIFLPVQ